MAPHLSLLLLTSLPTPATPESINEAYGEAIAATLVSLSFRGNGPTQAESQRLDIAIATSTSRAPKVSRFDHWQSVVAFVYQVVCAKAADLSLELDSSSGVDVRVFITDTFVHVPSSHGQLGLAAHEPQGPIIDITALAHSARDYTTIFAVDNDEGQDVLQKYSDLLGESIPSVENVPGGTTVHHSKPGGPGIPIPGTVTNTDLSYESVAVGGTFDHLHIGHKQLLFGTALAVKSSGERMITIGITGDELLKNKKFAEVMESWDTRQQRVADFIESLLFFSPSAPAPKEEIGDEPVPNGKYLKRIFQSGLTILYVQISDPYGPTITDEAITALIISAETRAGGSAVNKKREEKGWKPLEILEISVLDSHLTQLTSSKTGPDDFTNKISSTEIRKRLVQTFKKPE